MRRKYEITITTTLASPRGEGRDGGRKEMGRKGECGATGRDGKRRKDVEIMEDKGEKKGKDSLNIRESRIKVDQLHLQIAHAWPWPASPSL